MSKPYTMIVDIDGKLDTILKKIFRDLPIISLNTIYKCIRTKQIKVNGKRARRDTPVHAGDELTIYNYMMIDALDDPDKVVAQQIARESYTHMIVYEDDHRIGRNKPVGVVMHSGTNHLHDITMNTYLADYAAAYATPLFTPAFCYRLDRDTSGILISAKTHDSLVMINDMIKKRTIEKLYCAVVV